MPIDDTYNKSSYSPAYPQAAASISDWLRRESTTTPDELKDQARAINVILQEIKAIQEFLGTEPTAVEGDTISDFLKTTAIYGDGSDGDVTINGGTHTNTRDMYYNNLTITGTGILRGAFRIFVKNQLTIQSGGIITADANATNPTTFRQTAELTAGSLLVGSSGGNGGSAGNGSAGTASSLNTSASLYTGGNGGNGGGNTGGAGGASTACKFGIRDWTIGTTLNTAIGQFTAGAGGGGGAGSGVGGAGGAGGGIIMIAARLITNDGTIRARGSVGQDGQSGNSGGGGGGGGGLVLIYTSQAISGTSTIQVSGGNGGALAGTGNNGNAGFNGQSVTVIV